MMNSHSPPWRNSNAFVVIVNPLGPNQWARCLASVKASNTRRGGPSIVRERTISRSATDSSLGLAAMQLLLFLQFLHIGIEPVKALVPEMLEPADPLVNGLEPSRVQAVAPLLPRLPHSHQSHRPQHAQVLGGAGLRDPQRVRQVVHRALTPLEQQQNLPALRLGDRIECV